MQGGAQSEAGGKTAEVLPPFVGRRAAGRDYWARGGAWLIRPDRRTWEQDLPPTRAAVSYQGLWSCQPKGLKSGREPLETCRCTKKISHGVTRVIMNCRQQHYATESFTCPHMPCVISKV